MAFDLEKRLEEERQKGYSEEVLGRIREAFLKIPDKPIQDAFTLEEIRHFGAFFDGIHLKPFDLEKKLQEERERGYPEEFIDKIRSAFTPA